MNRADEIASNFSQVKEKISVAAQGSGRDLDQLTLIAVTKTFPTTDLEMLYSLGIREFGENRDQEAKPKAEQTADLEGVNWHFVGQLQSNKVKSVLGYAEVLHSLDRQSLLDELNKQAFVAEA